MEHTACLQNTLSGPGDKRCSINEKAYLVDKCADQFGFKDVPKRNPIKKS